MAPLATLNPKVVALLQECLEKGYRGPTITMPNSLGQLERLRVTIALLEGRKGVSDIYNKTVAALNAEFAKLELSEEPTPREVTAMMLRAGMTVGGACSPQAPAALRRAFPTACLTRVVRPAGGAVLCNNGQAQGGGSCASCTAARAER